MLLVSERKTQRSLLFRREDMRLVGWTNSVTGEVKSPYRDLNPSECLSYAFAGIHNISPEIFKVFDAMMVPERFSIIDFYLDACARYPVYGVPAQGLRLVDVGKADKLAEAEIICSEILGA